MVPSSDNHRRIEEAHTKSKDIIIKVKPHKKLTALISDRRDPAFVHKYAETVTTKVAQAEDIYDVIDIIQAMVEDIVVLQESQSSSRRQSLGFQRDSELEADTRLLANRLIMNKKLVEEYRKMELSVAKEIEEKLDLLKDYQINREVLSGN